MVLFLQSLWLSFCLFCLWFQGSSTAAFVYPNYPGHHSTPTPHSSTIRQQLNWQIPKSRNPLSSIENNQFARSQQPRRILPIILSSSTGAADESQELPDDQKDDTELVQEDANAKLKFWERLQNYMIQRKENDGLKFKQRLAKMGLSTVLSYGMISNLSYAILISLSWYGFAAKTGTSPLAPGQWKGFLAFYSGFWMLNNIIRPLRVGLSIASAPLLDQLVLFFQNRLKIRKSLAVTVTVVFVNIIGTILLMGGGIFLASTLAGVPIFTPKGTV